MKRHKDATVLLLLQRWETGYGVTSLSLFEIHLLSLSPLTSGMVVPESTDGCFIVLGNPHHRCGPLMSVQKRWWLLGGKARASGMYKVQFATLKLQILKPGNVRGNGSGIGRKGGIFYAAGHVWDSWTFSSIPPVLSPGELLFEEHIFLHFYLNCARDTTPCPLVSHGPLLPVDPTCTPGGQATLPSKPILHGEGVCGPQMYSLSYGPIMTSWISEENNKSSSISVFSFFVSLMVVELV